MKTATFLPDANWLKHGRAPLGAQPVIDRPSTASPNLVSTGKQAKLIYFIKLVSHLPDLEYLGYKETGKMIRTLMKTMPGIVLKLTHIDNRGSKMRRIIVNSLRLSFRRVVLEF